MTILNNSFLKHLKHRCSWPIETKTLNQSYIKIPNHPNYKTIKGDIMCHVNGNDFASEAKTENKINQSMPAISPAFESQKQIFEYLLRGEILRYKYNGNQYFRMNLKTGRIEETTDKTNWRLKAYAFDTPTDWYPCKLPQTLYVNFYNNAVNKYAHETYDEAIRDLGHKGITKKFIEVIE